MKTKSKTAREPNCKVCRDWGYVLSNSKQTPFEYCPECRPEELKRQRAEAESFDMEQVLRRMAMELDDPLGGVLRSVLVLADTARAERDATRERVLQVAALVCDRVATEAKKPDNKKAQDPYAAFKSGACRCAWEIRQLLKHPEGS